MNKLITELLSNHLFEVTVLKNTCDGIIYIVIREKQTPSFDFIFRWLESNYQYSVQGRKK